MLLLFKKKKKKKLPFDSSLNNSSIEGCCFAEKINDKLFEFPLHNGRSEVIGDATEA